MKQLVIRTADGSKVDVCFLCKIKRSHYYYSEPEKGKFMLWSPAPTTKGSDGRYSSKGVSEETLRFVLNLARRKDPLAGTVVVNPGWFDKYRNFLKTSMSTGIPVFRDEATVMPISDCL